MTIPKIMKFQRTLMKIMAFRNSLAGGKKLQGQLPLQGPLENPKKRAEIPADFPQTISPYSPQEALDVIRAELAKQGTTLEDARRINLAYPHKHPVLFPEQVNAAEVRVEKFRDCMKALAPHVEWVVANALCERVHLNRSGNPSSTHALTGRQVYDIYMPAQKDPFPFGEGKSAGEYFVVVDWTIEQGTTIANLMSYIRHNGGTVLMALADQHAPLVQRQTICNDNAARAELSAAFNDKSRNGKRLPEMALAFARSAQYHGHNWSPDECIAKLDAALHHFGNSVFTLTDGECAKLINTVNGGAYPVVSFPKLLDQLAEKASPPAPQRSLRPAGLRRRL